MKSKQLALSLAAMALMSAPALAADSSIGSSVGTDDSVSATTPSGQVSVDANVAAALDMQNLDADRNGSVSEKEFSAKSTLKNEANLFQSLDADKDGALSETELSAHTVEPSTIAPSSK
jgi:hypothetical protein